MTTRSCSALLVLAALALPMLATAGAEAKDEPIRAGAAITVKKPVDIARLAKNPKRFVGRTVRLEGVVKEVCQGMGCWIEVASPTGASFMARSLDHSVVVPKDCAGRKVVVQGAVTAMAGKGHEEHADHEPQPGEKPHACPIAEYVVATQGVELAAAKPR